MIACVAERPRGFAPAVGVLVLILALATAGCSSGGSAPDSATQTPASVPQSSAGGAVSVSVGPTGRFWLAVLEVADEPDALNGLTHRLAPILGGALIVSPVECYASLPTAAGSGYLLGAVAPDRAALEDLLSAHGLTPRFVVRTSSGCVD